MADGAGQMATDAMVAKSSVSPPHILAMARKAIRDPLVAFMAAGVALFGGYYAIEQAQKPPVVFTPQVEQAMVGEYETLVGRPADRKSTRLNSSHRL